MLGESFVQERVVRRQKVDHAPVFLDDALKQQFRFAAEALAQFVIPVGIEDAIRRSRRQIAQVKQLVAEVLDKRVGFGIRQHAAHLPLEHRSQMQFVLAGNFNEFVIRDAAPDQER